MLRTLTLPILVAGLLGTAGCGDANQAATPQPAGDASGTTPQTASHPENDPVDAHHADAEEHALPLRPIMLHMAAEMGGLMQALWLENYPGMAAHAGAIAGHAHISGEELARIEMELGPEMPAFEAADEAVHEASLRLRHAALEKDLDAFVEQLAEVQRGCVGCHSRFRDRLSTRATQ